MMCIVIITSFNVEQREGVTSRPTPSPRDCLVVNSASTLEWREARSRLVSSSVTVPDTGSGKSGSTGRVQERSRPVQAGALQVAEGGQGGQSDQGDQGANLKRRSYVTAGHSVSAAGPSQSPTFPHLPPPAHGPTTCSLLPTSKTAGSQVVGILVLESMWTAYDNCATAYRMGS